MINTDSPLAWLAFFVVFALIVLACLWQAIAPHEDPRQFAHRFFARRIQGVLRIWRFLGPRLTHKQTAAMVIGNCAILLGVDVANMDQLTMALWLGANLLFPPWDDLPNETLDGPRPQPRIEINGPVSVTAQ